MQLMTEVKGAENLVKLRKAMNKVQPAKKPDVVVQLTKEREAKLVDIEVQRQRENGHTHVKKYKAKTPVVKKRGPYGPRLSTIIKNAVEKETLDIRKKVEDSILKKYENERKALLARRKAAIAKFDKELVEMDKKHKTVKAKIKATVNDLLKKAIKKLRRQ